MFLYLGFYKYHKTISFFSSKERASWVSIYSKIRMMRGKNFYLLNYGIDIYNLFLPIHRLNRYFLLNPQVFRPYFTCNPIFHIFELFLSP